MTKEQVDLLSLMIDIFRRQGSVGFVDLDGELRLKFRRKLDIKELTKIKATLKDMGEKNGIKDV